LADKFKKILVIRLSSIGDIVLTTPVIHALRHKYPGATIDYLVMDRFREAIDGNPDISNVIDFQHEKYKGLFGIHRFSQKLKLGNYDLVVDLHAKLRSRLICMWLNTLTLRYTKRSLLKTIGVPLRLMRYQVDDTIVKNYFKPLRRIGVYFTEEKLHFSFSNSQLESVKAFENFVVMAPGAANATKAWPPEYFGRLGRMLRERIALIGASHEHEALEAIRSAIGNNCKNLAGRLSLKESGALISISKYVITNDSGPFHIARGVGKKAFVIFGPTDPGMFEYDSRSILIYDKKECAPCSLHGDKRCPQKHFSCMKDLTPEKIYAIIVAELNA
jgi:lipopolysaccharide heptosyltransferase II